MIKGLGNIDFFQMGQTCLGHSARRTSNLLTRHFNRHLAPFDLEITQAQLLAVIASGENLSASDIARYLGIDRSTLARNLKPLESAGLITRSQTGGRKVVPALTAKGERLAVDLHAAWQQAQDELTDHLGQERTQAIRDQLSALRQTVRALEQSAASASSDQAPSSPAKD
ncbi:MarR family transcriptional regulator [Roseibium denhamense]|uniref:Transcriptional regulator, MarR family n=1 Tax=Roseibium denhamense TaxID=76305 RepID=A0ABY1N577_9HYPH|nr:MarR family winged helix-turn-helix transcriptional regulator [Roseibium denhamense]MTI04663.1 MarR family transcriptional regulator [Roseibium denhamense]SMP00375.1 transcriptional regulator, MarR family [Roseibium denhamense]